MEANILAELPQVNPLEDFKLTFDHFYQFVKREAGAEDTQLIQIRAAAEPIDFGVEWPWFSYYSFLLKMDKRLLPKPITEDTTPEKFGLSDGMLSYEYGRLLAELVRMIEVKELPADINEKIAAAELSITNLLKEVDDLIELDASRWEKYANAMGFSVGDRNAFTQWMFAYGHVQQLDGLRIKLEDENTKIALLRLDKFSDADQEQIFEAFKYFSNAGSRLRWPRIPDNQYKQIDGTPPFTPDYLARLPTGDTPLFADRRYFFPEGIGLATIVSTGIGGFSETLTKESSSSEDITSDWGGQASGSYSWFSVSASASDHVSIKEDMKTTQSIKIGCKSLLKLPFDAKPWFNPEIFKNSYVLKNATKLSRYFGLNGTLRYYPAALIVARGMHIEFISTGEYKYNYTHLFSQSGGGSARFFGIGIGASANRSGTRQAQRVEKSGHTLILDDGEQNFRVLGYVVNKMETLEEALYGQLASSIAAAASLPGGIGVGKITIGGS